MFKSPFDFSSQNFLVTGASSGIGRVIAMMLYVFGANLILSGRNTERLKNLVLELSQIQPLETKLSCFVPGKIGIEPFDLNHFEEIPAWMKKITEAHGALNGLVHSAGLHSAKPLRFLDAASIEAVFKTNVESAMFLAKGFRQKNVCSSGASLVFLSSVVGLVGQVGVCAYSASKGALIALTKSLALELAPEKIRVNAVLPGVVHSEMTENLFSKMLPEQIERVRQMHPLGFGTPEDIAYAVSYLLSHASKWVTGSCLTVDGGYTAH